MGRELQATVDGSGMSIYLGEPEGAGPFPAVVITHHREGVDPFTRAVCDRLAKNGIVAAAPNLFHRRPKDEDTRASRKTLTDTAVVADINATVAALQGLKTVKRDRIGVMGHCMGGRMAYLGAASNPQFRAAVVLYGGGILNAEGPTPTPFALTKNIKCAIAGFFGNDDTHPSPAEVAQISDELKKFDIRHEFRFYDGTGHAFQNFTSAESYREQSSEDAWSRLVPFLKRELA